MKAQGSTPVITSALRRSLIITPIVFGFSLALSSRLAAQSFDEGIDYRVLRDPVPTGSPGKIEVLEFFWYGCPHCRSFERPLAAWKASLGPHVVFRKVHVSFREEDHQRLFYTLETLGQADRLSARVFDAIHVAKQPMNSLSLLKDWAKQNGIDPQQFEQSWASFSVQSQMKRANTLMQAHRIDSVPQLSVNGRYVTSPAMVGGSQTRALQVVDYLVNLERTAKGI
ncbi:MAG: thiol:disulfide interchange protein DsbA/DsbL [Burkholderiaceae bacterium]